jgi:hypothetical protein
MNMELWWGNLKEKKLVENLDVNGSIILKCIFKEKE